MKRPITALGGLPSDRAAGFGRRDLMRAAGLAALLGASGGLGLGLPAAAQDEALIAAAQEEGHVMLYTASEESIIAALSAAMSDKYGITLEYQRLNSRDVAGRYSAEAEAGKTVADVILTGDPILIDDFSAKGWIAPIDASQIPGFDAWPAEFKNDHSVIVSINPQTVAINTDNLKAPITSWQDLLRPDLKGQIVTVDLKRVGLVAFAAYDLMLKTYGEEFLTKLGQQDPRLFDSGPSAIQQLASGAAAAYFPASTTQSQSMIDMGAPVQAIIPEGEPYTGVMSPVAISANAPSPNAARLFVSFVMSEEGQKILNEHTASPNNTPGTGELKPGFVPPDMESSAANKDKIIQLMGL
ncbi:ABC transporter substrate-binding protein [Amaricoccus solimangrovi]|nr:extracellular solute-binding protein [Amaricoccus solimangrovi]